MLVSLSAVHGTFAPIELPPGFGADWSSHIAMPNQNAGCSWKLNVPPLASCTGRVGGSVGSVRRLGFFIAGAALFQLEGQGGLLGAVITAKRLGKFVAVLAFSA